MLWPHREDERETDKKRQETQMVRTRGDKGHRDGREREKGRGGGEASQPYLCHKLRVEARHGVHV
jgi:hypothetical protein